MIRRLAMAVMLLGLCLLATPLSATAFDTSGGVDCSGSAASSAVCTNQVPNDPNNPNVLNSANPVAGANGLLMHITNIIAVVAGAAAVIIIIVSALRLITSGSDVSTGSRTDTDVEDARRSLAGAVIGLVIIVLGRTLILYIVNRL